MKWKGEQITESDAVTGEYIGLEPIADGRWRIHFLSYEVGIFDERKKRCRAPRKPERRENKKDTL